MEIFQREMDRYRDRLSNVSLAVPLSMQESEKLNEVNPDGNLLMKAALWGTEEDIRFLLGIEGIAVNKTNSAKKTAADILWENERYEGLILVLQKDSHFPAGFKVVEVNQAKPYGKELVEFAKGRNELHAQIEKGDLHFVKNYTAKNLASLYYGEDNISALSRALDHDRREIYVHFLSFRPKFSVPENDIQQKRPSQLLQKTHLLKLAAKTKFADCYDREHWEAVVNMYLALEQYKLVRCLMEAIRNEDFEILFHITESTLKVDRVKAFGWTEINGRITIAARDLVTTDGQKDVYRVFAHEICHLVMIRMYKNAFHPFPQNNEKRKSEYTNILEDCKDRVSSLDYFIQRVFERNKERWIEELIVRIPEVVAVHGKEKSARIFEEQVPSLLKYYKDYIIPDCEEFGDDCYYSESLKGIKKIYKAHLAIRESDMDCSPFREIENYEDYLTPWETNGKEIFILRTTSPKLCATHIFHQFRKSHPLHTKKTFLAFSLEHYGEGDNKLIISKALESKNFKRLIFLVSERCHDLIENFFQNINFGSRGEKKVILVVPDELCQKEWKAEKCLTYHWCNLTEKFQDELMRRNVAHQGKKTTLEKLLDNVEITSKLLREILEQENLSMGEDWSYLRNREKLELYIERTFVQHKFKKENFSMQELPHYRLFITGLASGGIEKITKKDRVQVIKHGDEIQHDSCIFLPDHEEEVTELYRVISASFHKGSDPVPVFWLHYENGDFLVREFNNCEDIKALKDTSRRRRSDFEVKYSVKNQFDENEILQETKKKRVVLMADDPGTGKSTSARSIMDKIKEKNIENFIWKVYFEDLLTQSYHDFVKWSQNSIRTIMRVCKITGRFGEMIFPSLMGQFGRVVLFLDGYDEINQDLRAKALKILKSIRDETKIQLWVLTRKHERLPLEVKMNTVSFSLAQFSEEDQLNYLNRFWKHKIGQASQTEGFTMKLNEMVKNLEKYSKECSSLYLGIQKVVKSIGNQSELKENIHSLDFHSYSKKAIDMVWKEVLVMHSVPPLWLWMMATIITEKSLQIPVRQDVFTFYLDFSKLKVDLFLKEKCELKLENNSQIRLFNRAKKQIVDNLLAFSDMLFGSLLFKEGQVKEGDLEELVDVGLVKKVGIGYRFLHKTLGDFFFTQAIIRSCEVEKEIKASTCFLEKLLCPTYHEYLGVRNFLYCFIEQSKTREVIFPKHLLEEPQLSRAFLHCCQFAYILTSKEIVLWRRIIQDCDNQLDGNESDILMKKIDEKLIMHEDPELFLEQVFHLALRTFGEEFSHKLSDKLQIEDSCALSLELSLEKSLVKEKHDQISFN